MKTIKAVLTINGTAHCMYKLFSFTINSKEIHELGYTCKKGKPAHNIQSAPIGSSLISNIQ
jgi:hypothetical protein